MPPSIANKIICGVLLLGKDPGVLAPEHRQAGGLHSEESQFVALTKIKIK